MIVNPVTASPELVRKNLEAQLTLLMSVSGKLMNALLQLSELNRQASRRLLEETAADMQKALRIQTLPDAQAFLGEQSRSSLEKIRGYWQNVQAITEQNWPVKLPLSVETQDPSAAPPQAAAQEAAGEPEQEPKQEDAPEMQPPALVQKLIASAVPAKPGRRA